MEKTNLQLLLGAITKKHIYIQTHNYPDPDALASAKGLQMLLRHYGVSSSICFSGYIDKQSTLNMVDLLAIEIHSVETLSLQEDDEIILVDCQKGNTNVQDFTGNEIACIDHHKLQATDCYRFFDIQSHVGSCSTLIASYFIENNVPIDCQLATALLYGLKMDTSNLTRGVSSLDVDVFSFLYKISRHDILWQLDSSKITLMDLAAYSRAIQNLTIIQRIGFSNVGNGLSDAILGTLADFFLTLNEIDFVVTYSIRQKGIKFSVRSAIEAYNCADIIKNALEGFGDGGGHAHMAAGFLPLESSEEEAMAIVSQMKERFQREVFASIHEKEGSQ